MVCMDGEMDGFILIFIYYKFFYNKRWREKLWILGVIEEVCLVLFLGVLVVGF